MIILGCQDWFTLAITAQMDRGVYRSFRTASLTIGITVPLKNYFLKFPQSVPVGKRKNANENCSILENATFPLVPLLYNHHRLSIQSHMTFRNCSFLTQYFCQNWRHHLSPLITCYGAGWSLRSSVQRS
jgi:hypothetical protein